MNHSDSTNGKIQSVPMLDLKSQYQSLKTEIDAAVAEVLESQYFIMGPVVQRFEKKIAEYCGCDHAIGVSSGSDALLVALMALDIGPGQDVITSPFTFFATGGAIARLGATPVYCDINPDTYNLDPDSIASYIDSHCEYKSGVLNNKKTGNQVKAIIPVHLFGQAAHMDGIMALANQYGLKVIEDAAQAIGSKTDTGHSAGTIGDIGCYSFFPSKNLGAFGDAGMVVTNDPELAERLSILRLHGSKPKYYHAFIGGNFRLDAIQAAVLEVKLSHLDSWTSARQANIKRYNEILSSVDALKLPFEVPKARHIYNQYTLSTINSPVSRDMAREKLAELKISTEIYYPVPLHLQECFKYLGYQKGDVPIAESAALNVFSIPIHPELSSHELEYVADSICNLFK